jgi:hypothetical protein
VSFNSQKLSGESSTVSHCSILVLSGVAAEQPSSEDLPELPEAVKEKLLGAVNEAGGLGRVKAGVLLSATTTPSCLVLGDLLVDAAFKDRSTPGNDPRADSTSSRGR